MKVALREMKAAAQAVVLPLFDKGPTVANGDEHAKSCQKLVNRVRRSKVFRGDLGEVCVQVDGQRLIVLFGLGAEKKLDGERLRRAAGALSRRVAKLDASRVVLPLVSAGIARPLKKLGWERGVRALAEGLALGDYRYDAKSKSTAKKGSASITLDPSGLKKDEKSAARRGSQAGQRIADGVLAARELANIPANDLYPASLASHARRIARASGLRCRVLGKPELTKEKMGALLAVAQGSSRAPRMIILEHRPKRSSSKTLVLVGKAVTFDSGGLSIKPARGMEDMKFDMAGGAAVIGAIQAIAAMSLPIRVVALVPAAENHISGTAYRPGDVIRSASGKTIEVINTDAEGRLLLADALHYSRRYEPDAVVDVATLTGACVVALGTVASGMMANDDGLAKRLLAASESSGERIWHLPLYEEYRDQVRSSLADVRNSSGRDAGVCTAGAFLSHFAEGLSWAHLDIAGTGWTHRERGYQTRGATGAGVRVLVELAQAISGARPRK